MTSPILLDDDDISFPPLSQALDNGLLAVGGDLSPERLLNAYANGIFPWFNPGDPILWWSPSSRAILYPSQLKISKSLSKSLKKPYRVSFDQAFAAVITACSQIPRNEQAGTWITQTMIDAYQQLHELGFAHSVEVWEKDELIGGLYGISLGHAFFGESMFHLKRDASKIALHALCQQAIHRHFDFIDCQLPNPHLSKLGVIEIAREDFITLLAKSLESPTQRGKWSIA